MRHALLIAAMLAATGPAYATSLVCENPGNKYLVTIADGADVAIINPDSTADRMPIIGRIDTDEIRAVVLKTPDPTVTEILHTWPEPKMEIFSDGDLVQVDPCV